MIVEAEVLRWPLDGREIEFNLFTNSRTKMNIISDKYFSYGLFKTRDALWECEIEKIYDSYDGDFVAPSR